MKLIVPAVYHWKINKYFVHKFINKDANIEINLYCYFQYLTDLLRQLHAQQTYNKIIKKYGQPQYETKLLSR